MKSAENSASILHRTLCGVRDSAQTELRPLMPVLTVFFLEWMGLRT
jgi:hypothetical protein